MEAKKGRVDSIRTKSIIKPAPAVEPAVSPLLSNCVYTVVFEVLNFAQQQTPQPMEVDQNQSEPIIPLSCPLVGWSEGSKWSDPRRCIFCRCAGDDDAGFLARGNSERDDASSIFSAVASYRPMPHSGRLLPIGLSLPGGWAHTNCALWSSEVYENEIGHLFSVQNAVRRSNSKTVRHSCAGCGIRQGASLGCCAKECKNVYHFACAAVTGGIFCENKDFFCLQHRHLAGSGKRVPLNPNNITEIMRCVVVASITQNKAQTKGQQPFKITGQYQAPADEHEVEVPIRIGSLIIHSLGEIVTDSDRFNTEDLIFPRNFTATRIYWSCKLARTRTVYSLRILEGADGSPVFSIVAADDRESPINEKDPDEAFAILRDRILKVNVKYFISNDSKRNDDRSRSLPVMRGGTSTLSKKGKAGQNELMRSGVQVYGLSLGHFFGFGLRPIRTKLENLEDSKFLAVPLTESSVRYHFSFVSPTEEGVTKVQRLRASEAALNELNNASGSARTEGLNAFLKNSGSGRITRALMAEAEAKLKTGEEKNDMVVEEAPPPTVTSKTRGKKRRAIVKDSGFTEEEEAERAMLGFAAQYEQLKSVPLTERLQPLRSHIHGWGLFTKIAIRAGEMIIEYCGELIRTTVSDRREQNYESSGIGSCYMFRLDKDMVVDATMNGCMARFMNHCCVPNCFAKTIKVPLGNGFVNKIVIIAKTNIKAGEEIVYDYQFQVEDGSLACTCGHPKCIGAMN